MSCLHMVSGLRMRRMWRWLWICLFSSLDTCGLRAERILSVRQRHNRAKPPPRASLSHPWVKLSAVKDSLQTHCHMMKWTTASSFFFSFPPFFFGCSTLWGLFLCLCVAAFLSIKMETIVHALTKVTQTKKTVSVKTNSLGRDSEHNKTPLFIPCF